MTSPTPSLAPLTWRIETGARGWAACRAAWQEIGARGAAIALFQSYDWLDAWRRAAAADAALRVLIGADGEGTSAILPLVVARRRLLRRLGWMAEAVSDYGAPIAVPGLDAAQFGAGLRDALGRTGADLVQLDQVRPDHAGARLLEGALRAGPSAAVAPYIDLAGRDFDAVERGFSASLRQDLRRKARRLGERAPWRYAEADTEDRRRAAVEFVLTRKSRQLAGDPVALAQHDREFAPLARDVFSRPAIGPARTHVATLQADGAILAAHLGFVDAERFYYYVPAYDDAFQEFSPGHLLMLELIRRACETRVPVFDMLRGDYGYKRRLTDRAVALRRFDLALTVRGRAWRMVAALRGLMVGRGAEA